MATESMLTTVDNPYDPFTEFNEWLSFDTRKGYHTLALLARVTNTSEDLSEYDQNLAIDEAIDEIIFYNVSGMHKKVTRDTSDVEQNV